MTSYKPPQNSGDFRADKWREAVATFCEGEHYSSTERATGRVWIDGSPIYSKVISLGTMPNTTTANVAHGISDLDNILSYRGFMSDGSNHYPLPYVDTTTASLVEIKATDTNIVIVTATNWSLFTGYLFVEYTKT